jgi:hypothetical protein
MSRYPSTLALSLLNPWMLLGLLLAAIPLMIHLFYRRRYQEVKWAAVLFLSGAVKRNAQKNRLQQLLLLLLRTLALIALVFAFARPLINSNLAAIDSVGQRHSVFVIDASLSMRCRQDEGTRFSAAINVAKEIVEASNKGDTFQLLTIAGETPEVILGQPTAEPLDVLAALNGLKCSGFGGAVQPAWPATRRLLKTANATAQTTVYVLSDFQTKQWGTEGTEATTGDLSEIASRAKLSFVDVSESLAPNLSVSGVKVDQKFVTANQQATIRVVLQNSDKEKAVDRDIRLLVDDLVVSTQRVSVNAFTRLTFPFQYRAVSAGRHRVTIEIDADRLPDDNRVHQVLNVYDDIPILLVNGKPSSRHMGNATDFLKLSLAPGADSGWKTPYDVQVISEVELGTVDPADYAAVFLCNVRQFTTDEAIRLRNYAHSGGAVVICPGDLADLPNYNSQLFGASGLLPGVQLVSMVGSADRPQEAFEFDSENLSHPMMTVYRGNPGHGLEQVLTFQYLKAVVNESSTNQSVLKFSNGDPVLIESAVGAGACCLVTVAGDDSRWSTWNTTSGTFVSLMNEVTEFLVSGRDENRQAIVGEPWTRPIVATVGQVPFAAFDDGAEQPLRVVENTTGDEIQADTIVQPGFLSVLMSERQQLVACNFDPAEADLRTLSVSQIRQRLLPDTDFSYAKASQFAVISDAAQTNANNEGAFVLFALVVALLIAEQLLASRVGTLAWAVFATGCLAVLCLALFPDSHAFTFIVLVLAAMLLAFAFRQYKRSVAPS